MNPTTTVVFDLGKVLLDFDYRIAARRIAERSRLDEAGVQAVLERSPWLIRYETGLISRREFYEAIRRETGFEGSLEEFSRFFADIFWPIEPMVAVLRALRRRGLATWLFSNTNDLAMEHIRRNFPFVHEFDGCILSYEVRSMKPAPGMYESLERLSGRRGSEILYLDDRPENVEAGRARGWQGWVHTSPEDTRRRLRELGLLDAEDAANAPAT
ncbi:HAD family hydrolase [Limisphaera sp. VF-2]|jgi:HAD superfamily hydrolase (TIGR01509 family)|uniref:HAD family hydrolase n=1 Tax=Limisphaera sp. VF-2 TaxID=3400418 RepID=UPI0017527C73|nr:HAD family phosphatase [Limisphaera sp.]